MWPGLLKGGVECGLHGITNLGVYKCKLMMKENVMNRQRGLDSKGMLEEFNQMQSISNQERELDSKDRNSMMEQLNQMQSILNQERNLNNKNMMEQLNLIRSAGYRIDGTKMGF